MSTRREFIGQLIAAGPTRTAGGGAGGYVVTAGAIREAIDAGLFRGLACFVDHEAQPSVRRLVGVWQDVGWQEATSQEAILGQDGARQDDNRAPVGDSGRAAGGVGGAAGMAVGRLRVYETEETQPVVALLEQTLAEAEPPDVGISLVFYPRLAADGRTITGIAMIESADLVMFPASAGSRIWGVGLGAEEAGEQGGRGVGESKVGSHSQLATKVMPFGYPEMLHAAPLAVTTLNRLAQHPRPHPHPVAQAFLPANDNSRADSRDNGDGLKPIADRLNALKRVAGEAGGSGSAFQRAWPGSGGFQSATGGAAADTTNPADGRAGGPDAGRDARATAGGLPLPARAFQRLSLDGGATSAADDPAAGRNARATVERAEFTLFTATPTGAQEAAEMTQQNETTALRRVALVRGAEAQGSRGAGEQGGADGGAAVDGWLEALRTAAATAVIRASGLPAAVQERLGAGSYESADEVYAAVEQARGELAALSEAGVVQLGGRPPRGALSVRDPLDEARGLVGFFFGAADVPTPPPNMRSFADLYVALTGDAYFRGVFDGDRVQFSGATTSTLPNLAVDAMNRVIVEQFAALDHYRWYERISDVAPNDGRLHDMKWITLGGVGNLPTVNEGAAYTELSVADVKETAAFVKRGGYVGITREMIKNSDIMQLQAIPRALAAAAVRTRSAAVAALFTSGSGVGPTLSQDSKALFHADHANLATTALGTDATAWRAARAECFQQPEVGTAKPLGIFPRFLLVPAELYDTALSILGYGEGMPTAYAPEAQGRGFADPRPIPLVVPDWTDATDWAYIVDPALFPVIQMSYSQSPGGRRHPIPELFAVVSETSGLMFSNDVLPIKVRDEFAVGVNGPRGIGKRNVA